MKNTDNIAVKVEKLEKKFGPFTAVDRIDFEVKRGEIFGFLGPNGAGKSTTIRMLCGIIVPTSGNGIVGGYDIRTQQDRIKENIGYMSQRFSLYDDLTVEENIDFYSGIYRIAGPLKKERMGWVLEMAGLKDLKDRLTGTLSGGWKQRLALGCAIIHRPGIIFLDEPTSGVDPISRQNFWNIIKSLAKEGAAVFVTTHYMDEAENCERMALIYKGDLIAIGTPLELKTKFMSYDVFRIMVSQPEEWMDRIAACPGVKDTALFGTALHAVVSEREAASASIKGLFEKGGASYTLDRIQPSLEDVFVSLIESYDKGEKKP